MTTDAVSVVADEFRKELDAEARATRECLENVPVDEFDWKPHEKSMNLGYLSQLVADIPRWLVYTIDERGVDFATYPQFKGTTNKELIDHFEEHTAAARAALGRLTEDILAGTFTLRHGEKVLYESPIHDTLGSTINHMVHHRGQLTVYLRLLDVAVPSIYGPSADSGGFETL